MDREINIYSCKDKVHFVLCGLEGSVTTFFQRINTKYVDCLEINDVYSLLKSILLITDAEFLSSRASEPFSMLGYNSFQDLFKKTNLTTLRLENSKIKIFEAKKVKRWYEFEPIDPIDGFDMDDESMKKLSARLLDVLRNL